MSKIHKNIVLFVGKDEPNCVAHEHGAIMIALLVNSYMDVLVNGNK